jgi:hypothetical protein
MPNRTIARVALPLCTLLLVGCSRASLLGGPGPEAAHHASPAHAERLAELETGRKFKSKDECRSHIATLAHLADPAALTKISDLEVRAYHSEGDVHHEYSCVGKQMMERSWSAGHGHQHASAAQHGAEEHADIKPASAEQPY